jgi:hypothetical protein
MRRDWFRHRVFRPAAEAAGLDWRVRVHDLRHASASWALAGGATVQQVRDHLGHISLRAVERYLHSLPGADNGAAGAIARVKETGTLYPAVIPSYTPARPTVPVDTGCAVQPAPETVVYENHGGSAPQPSPASAPLATVRASLPLAAAGTEVFEPRVFSAEKPAPERLRAEEACGGVPEGAARIAPEGGVEHADLSPDPGEDAAGT